MPAGVRADAASVVLTHEAVPGDQVVDGSPTTGCTSGTPFMGVWEMTPGAMRDIEVDEVFVVLSGEATVDFVEPALPSIELRPGVIVPLTAGMSTVWRVHRTLRKFSFTV
jgi:uncharacterized protein